MTYFTFCIAITIVLYALIAYMSYITAYILHQGIVYKVAVTIIKTSVFLALCYISIISDVVLFHDSLYKALTIKNGLLLLLVVASLVTAKTRKENTDEHNGEQVP